MTKDVNGKEKRILDKNNNIKIKINKLIIKR